MLLLCLVTKYGTLTLLLRIGPLWLLTRCTTALLKRILAIVRPGAPAYMSFPAHALTSVASYAFSCRFHQGFPEALAGTADAVFLDLPGPAKVVPSAAASLRPDGVIVSFSPCIEQVRAMM